MDYSHSFQNVESASPSYLPSSNPKTTIRDMPLEVLVHIFKFLPFSGLKLFTEHKVKILNKKLTGEEDSHRLMVGDVFIFTQEQFSEVAKQVYAFALCCQTFYELTERERNLLHAYKSPRLYNYSLLQEKDSIYIQPPPPSFPPPDPLKLLQSKPLSLKKFSSIEKLIQEEKPKVDLNKIINYLASAQITLINTRLLLNEDQL